MAFASYLNSLCTIQSLSTSVSVIGEVIEAYANVSQVKCRLDSLLQGGKTDEADRYADRIVKRVFLSPVSIDATNRIQSGGRNYNILQSDSYDQTSVQHHIELIVEEVE